MSIIYLKDKETKTTKQQFNNVTNWNEFSIEGLNNNYPFKIYCGETEYFTDKEVEENDREN